MRSADVYPSKYLKAEELEGDLTVTIKEVVMEELESKDKGKQNKPVVYFKEMDKGLVVNKTNWSMIAKQHGDESDDWTGKQIVLHAMDVEAFGEMVLSIRVIQPRKPAVAKPAAAAVPVISEEDITAYWTEVKKQGLERKQGLEFLNKNKQDFKLALAALQKADDVPF
jgi:hypothetical protein